MEVEQDEETKFSSVKRDQDLFKSNLISKLAASPQKDNVNEVVQKTKIENRERLNSLRNGETAKVIQT